MVDNTTNYAIYGNIGYRDPLELYDLSDFTNSVHRDLNLRGEPVFLAYISEIDSKIFSEVPDFNIDFSSYLDEFNSERYSDLFITIADNSRMQDFIIVQLYNEEPYWRVFIPSNVKELIKDDDKYVKAKVTWYESETAFITKNVSQMYEEELTFGDEYACWIFSFRPSRNTGKIGYSDITQALWTLVINLRKIRTQIDLASGKPEFKHFIFGENASQNDINAIVNEADHLNVGNAIGAKESTLMDIKTHKIENGQFMLDARVSKYKEIALVTNLPAAFFMGEREAGSGNQGNNVTADSIEVEKKKEMIFDRIKPLIIKIVNSRWGITVTDAKIGKVITSNENNDNTLMENNQNGNNRILNESNAKINTSIS